MSIELYRKILESYLAMQYCEVYSIYYQDVKQCSYRVLRLEQLQFVHTILSLRVNHELLLQYLVNTNPKKSMIKKFFYVDLKMELIVDKAM